MERIFYKKTTAVIFIAAILIVVLLLCMLLVLLTQMSSLNRRADELNELIQSAKTNEEDLKKLLELWQQEEYVRKWAEDHNKIKDGDITWVEDKLASQQG